MPKPGGYLASQAVHLLWQRWIGPRYNRKKNILCRFHPSCSEYSKQAFRKYGVVKGTTLTVGRIRRCVPSNLESCVDFP